MKLRPLLMVLMVLLFLPGIVMAATLGPDSTEMDSTQPRGDVIGDVNAAGQDLSPIDIGLMSPHQRAEYDYDLWDDHYSWSGMAMANSMRDPSFMAMLSVVNKYFIKYLNAIPGDPTDPASEVSAVLADLGLGQEGFIRDEDGFLQPEDKLPVAADLCLRCHTPPGWMEGHSEPATVPAPFLKGQFWGAAFTENPVDADGFPTLWDQTKESESEIDGIQCDFCHRIEDNFKTTSNYDGSEVPNGNGGYFLDRTGDYLGHDIPSMFDDNPHMEFLDSAEMCATCHNVTNPVFKTRTEIDGVVPDVLHPVERTYTEWRFSDFGDPSSASFTLCQECHFPMDFLGAQTWLLNPGLGKLWGAVDERWSQEPYNYNVPVDRDADIVDPADPLVILPGPYVAAKERNQEFMKGAATIEFVDTPTSTRVRRLFRPTIRITNLSGHKLPTGYPEGRQMWIDLRVVDKNTGWPIFASGFTFCGKLIRTFQTKVYEMVSEADGYDDLEIDGYNILDANRDGYVSEHEKEFHFILGNKVVKDNRIPPKGFNREAYFADAAFIIPRDFLDNDYPDGQNWDDTKYTFYVPRWVRGPLEITATLKYQTFSKEFVSFLEEEDEELTEKFGGRMRNVPEGGEYGDYQTWGAVIKEIWKENGNGAPVEMATTRMLVDVTRR